MGIRSVHAYVSAYTHVFPLTHNTMSSIKRVGVDIYIYIYIYIYISFLAPTSASCMLDNSSCKRPLNIVVSWIEVYKCLCA